MVTIIFFVIVGLVIGIYRAYKEWNTLSIHVINSIIGVLIGFIVGLVIAIILPMKTYNKHYSISIQGIQDNSSVKGNFYLGCGQIDGSMKYAFYSEENGMYKMMQLDYNSVQIKYTEGKPKVNVTERSITNDMINLFALDLDIGQKTYIIEVPNGTIKNNFNLDAQ